ncbi:MAG TPA: DUF1571 domain-containing protein [Isosphaeraceae bacterium]|jgi:hypothetical protein|nr:DUF1571 domain-containing protein [Isosphaeraceae bacterium]
MTLVTQQVGAVRRTRGPSRLAVGVGLLFALAVVLALGLIRAGDPGPIDDTADRVVAELPREAPRPAGSRRVLRASAVVAERPAPEDPIRRARRAIADCRERFQAVKDYTCTFLKRERVDGKPTPLFIMAMKVRSEPRSLYLRLQQPRGGREAIFVAGRDRDRALVHDVGLGRLLAGTLRLDPKGPMAMEDCRHPITEAGLGHLIETVSERWNAELRPGESRLEFDPACTVAGRPCLRIDSTHTEHRPGDMFQRVRLFIDDELGLPIRFEAYDWPAAPGAGPELVEEYTYKDLRLNVGLTDLDFDTRNPAYKFGRF